MAVSKDFLDQLDKLIQLSDGKCICDENGTCLICKAKMELEQIQYQVSAFLESVE